MQWTMAYDFKIDPEVAALFEDSGDKESFEGWVEIEIVFLI